MGFLKKLFGSGSRESRPSDAEGFFVYVQCDKCHKKTRLRIIKQHDLNYDGDGYIWHKTIVDSKCFQPIPAVVHFDRNMRMVSQEIDGGHFISQAEYEQSSVSGATDLENSVE